MRNEEFPPLLPLTWRPLGGRAAFLIPHFSFLISRSGFWPERSDAPADPTAKIAGLDSAVAQPSHDLS